MSLGRLPADHFSRDLPFGSFPERTVYVIDTAVLEEDAQDLICARAVTMFREHTRAYASIREHTRAYASIRDERWA